MAVDLRFILAGAKRVFDSRPLYAQVVVTDDCNLTCAYCDEYTPGAPIIPLAQLQQRIDHLDALGVRVYDLLGGEPLLETITKWGLPAYTLAVHGSQSW